MAVKHKVTTKQDNVLLDKSYGSLIRQVVKITLKEEPVNLPCVVNVLITDDEGIRKYNREHRGIDRPTDVLSFPMQEYKNEGWNGLIKPDIDMDTQTVPLGDIAISVKTVRRNANKFKCTFEQEIIRMIIHSVLHLLGYDHGIDMESKENKLMEQFGYKDEYQ